MRFRFKNLREKARPGGRRSTRQQLTPSASLCVTCFVHKGDFEKGNGRRAGSFWTPDKPYSLCECRNTHKHVLNRDAQQKKASYLTCMGSGKLDAELSKVYLRILRSPRSFEGELNNETQSSFGWLIRGRGLSVSRQRAVLFYFWCSPSFSCK